MKNISILLFLFLTSSLFAQEDSLYVYDFSAQTLDSIDVITNPTSATFDQTEHFIGDFNSNIESLAQATPSNNLFPNTLFTVKKRVTDDLEITNFPIRTAIKLYLIEDDTLRQFCSGNMVSSKHVLTAAHCVYDFGELLPRADSILICPIFNDGLFSVDFPCSQVAKVFYPKNWETEKDIALLELENPIGEETGWIGMGFNNSNDCYTEGIYHKFSYPMQYLAGIDPREFNGDTLYHSYGKVDFFQENFIGVEEARGIGGESGSSLTLIENEETYTSYGVMVWSYHMRHTRMKDWLFYTFQNIMGDALTNNPELETEPIVVFPNPANELLSIKGVNVSEIKNIKFVDNLGRIVKIISSPNSVSNIDISTLVNGIYFMLIKTNNNTYNKKIIKNKS